MKTTNDVRLGTRGASVFPIALGCMGMGAGSWYGDSDEAESVATIHEAIERGVDVLDTGDFYGMGRNELLVGKAVKGRRDKVLLSVKFGAFRGPDGEFLGLDTRPAATRTPSRTACRALASITSTSTGQRASIQTCRSRIR